jgi:glycosyltransferase involved in cell wall biosynthesis
MNKMNRRLLVVGMTGSPHLKKWLDHVIELRVAEKIFVFPSTGYEKFVKSKNSKSSTKVLMAIPFASTFIGRGSCFILEKIFGKSWRKILLNVSVFFLRPEVIHIHEIQHGGYIFDRNSLFISPVKRVICSSWGSDLILYGKLSSHERRLTEFLSSVDILLTERLEEFDIASQLGFKGKFISPAYTSIGFEFEQKEMIPPSIRKTIVVKGYQDNHGRALNVLSALERAESDLLKFEIRVVSASREVEIEVERLRILHGWDIECLPKLNQEEMHKLLSCSRLYLGLSISDGLSTMMVEAMRFGAFPIQSANSGAPTFLLHGKSGFIVDPWDLSSISQCIDVALTNNSLVDLAVEINQDCLKDKFNLEVGLNLLKSIYLELK